MLASGTAFDASGAPIAGAAFTWASRDTTVATVDADGTVAGRLVGSAWIVGTHGALSDSALVTVTAGAVASVDVEPDTLSFTTLGQTQQLGATTTDSFGNDCGCTPTWFSQDPAVATVDASGLATAVANGATYVVANVDGVRDSALVVVSTVGASITWLGVTSSDWADASNWSTGALPTGADTVFVPAAAAFQPVSVTEDSIGGLIVEAGATLTVEGTLAVTTYLLGDGDVTGSGILRLRDTEVRNTESEGVVRLTGFEAAGQTFLWNRVVATGNVVVPAAAYLELTYGGLETTGDLLVSGDDAFLGVWDSLIVGGTLEVGGGETAAAAYLANHESTVVGGNLVVSGRGLLEFANPSNTLAIAGDARWEGVLSGEGIMPEGTIEIAGDWYQQGPSFHSPDLLVVFNGTGAAQQITHLDVGHGAGQGHFGPVHVVNPAGVQFLTPTLIRGTLSSEPGAPIVGDTITVEGNIDAGGDLTAVAIHTTTLAAAGTVLASSANVVFVPSVGGFAVDSVTYRSGTIETLTAPVSAALPYAALAIDADSALFDGPASISGNLHVRGVTTLGGRTTVGGAVSVDGAAGEMILAGHTLELTGTGAFSTGATTGAGVLTMTQPSDSLIAKAVELHGASTAGRLTDGVIITDHVAGTGLALHASGAHKVVLDGTGIGSIDVTGGAMDDGVGARFATLEIPSTSDGWVDMLSDAYALFLVIDDVAGDAQVTAPAGSPRQLVADSVRIDGAYLSNVPLVVLGRAIGFGDPSGLLAIDNVTFAGFDAGLTQLDVTHDASGPFTFTGMTFDPIADGTTDGSLYVRATRNGSLDANLRIEIDDLNVDNGEDFTADDDATADVVWVNDTPAAPAPATIAWTGGSSADWFDAANWNTGVAPVASDIVWVFASAPNQPQLAQPDTIAGLLLEDGAEVQLADSLVVNGSVRAGSSILDTGAGVLHVVGTLGVDTVSGVLPSTIADGVTFSGVSTLVDGDLTIRGAQGAFAESPLQVTGTMRVEETIAVSAALDVDGALEILGGRVGAGLQLQAGGTAIVGDSLHVGGSGTLVMQDASNVVTVMGNARFSSDFSSDGLLSAGTMRLHGDLYAAGGALHSTGTTVELRAAVDQRLEIVSSGASPIKAQLQDLAILKAGGIVYLESDLYVAGDLTENAGYPVFDTAQAHTLTVVGVVDMGGSLTVDSLRFGGSFLNVGGVLTAHTTEFFGASQPIPASFGYENVLVSGSGTWSLSGGTITGNLAVTGSLVLNGDMDVAGITTVAGAVQLNGNRLGTTDLDVALGGLSLSNASDSLVVRGGSADFRQPSSSTLSAGVVVVEQGGNFVTEGDAFRSIGTALHMSGDTLFMSDAGPGALQGALSTLYLGRPASFIVVDSVYVSGNVVDLDSAAVVDRGQFEGGWYGEIRVEGDIQTPRTGFSFMKLRLGGALNYDFASSDVDSTQFTGAGQTIPVVDAFSQPLSHGTIVVTGTDVHLGSDASFLDISGDVIVRGAGAGLTVHSNDNGFLGSLHVAAGDASTRAVIHDAVTVRDSVVVAAGVLDLGAQFLGVNDDGRVATALRTSGTGRIQLSDPAAHLYVANGDARFEGGSTDGLLTAGLIELSDSTGFYSTGAAFHSTGTALVHRGDTIAMRNAGPTAGQGRLASLQYGGGSSPELEVVDSLYIAGDLLDTASGYMLHDNGNDALVVVTGNVVADSSQVVIDHAVVGGQLQLTAASNWAVDTTQFSGTNQLVPAVDLDGGPIGYNVVLLTGSNIDFNWNGSFSNMFSLPNSEFILRGPGSSARIHNNDGPGTIGSLRLEGGDASQLLTLMASLQVYDSVRVETGSIDLNGFGLIVNANGAVANGLTVTGAGRLVMDDVFDALDVVHGPAEFTSTSPSIITAGTIDFGGDFRSVNDAFVAAGVPVTFNDPAFDGTTITMVNGGAGAGQGRFDDVVFNISDVTLQGSVFLTGDMTDFADGTLGIVGGPASSLELGALDLTSGSDLKLPLLVVHDSIRSFFSGIYDVDVTEYAGAGQIVNRTIEFDTLIVSGSATRALEVGVTDTIARVVLVTGSLGLTGGTGTQMMIADSLVIDGFSALFDHNGSNLIVGNGSTLDGGLVTANGGLFVMKTFGYLSLNGDAHFAGGSTADLITDGLMYVRGDFYAENGAFQASGNHQTSFEGTPAPITIDMQWSGPRAGEDHFNHLHLATQNAINIASDVYVAGDLSDYFDGRSSTVLYGAADVSIVSDGWDLNSGITLNNVTLALDEDVNTLRPGTLNLDNVVFGSYDLTGATRLQMRHPGLSRTLQFNDVDFGPSQSYPGAYVHVFDSDGVSPDALGLLFYYPSYPTIAPPADLNDPSRVIEENGATVSWNTP
ncbi:MAG TPA: Ig-like domain-containing protein [Longimicrobiales bacterium]